MTVLAAIVSNCRHFNPKGAGSPSAGLLSSCWLRTEPLAYLLVPLSCMASKPSYKGVLPTGRSLAGMTLA